MIKTYKKISEKTIERLSTYRHHLKDLKKRAKTRVYSHELSLVVSGTAAQVRRDLMEVGCSGCSSKGYDVELLIGAISELLDPPAKQNVALVGVGNLGRALLGYFSGMRNNYEIIACFDNDPSKYGRVICGRRCYSLEQLPAQINELKITTAILAIPAEQAEEIADLLINSGIKAILNLAPRHITTNSDVFIETLDMSSALEKAIYFSRKNPK